jgi:FkbM family methyltransferase
VEIKWTKRKLLFEKAVVFRRLVDKVENWPTVLVRYVAARFGIASGVAMKVRLRDGLVVEVPAAPLSSWPIFEVLVLDCYHTSVVPGSPAVILDIGAHVGSASLALHRAFPGARIVCYEPSPATAHFLRRNLSENGVTGEVHEFAVAGCDGHAYLVSDTATSCEASLLFEDSGGTPVSVVSFDHVMENLGSGPVLLKLDCEGSEFDILEQSLDSSFSNVQTVLLEYHPRKASSSYASVCAGLERFGFSEVWHDPDPLREGLGLSCFVRSSG